MHEFTELREQEATIAKFLPEPAHGVYIVRWLQHLLSFELHSCIEQLRMKIKLVRITRLSNFPCYLLRSLSSVAP
jgi:hypothetical protein